MDRPGYLSDAEAIDGEVRCAPHELAAWASLNHHRFGGPDNCWTRVYVRPAGLKAFFEAFDQEMPQTVATHPGQGFIIESEEF